MKERIGETLVRIGAITQEQMDTILSKQKAGDTRLFGEIAVDLGLIDPLGEIKEVFPFRQNRAFKMPDFPFIIIARIDQNIVFIGLQNLFPFIRHQPFSLFTAKVNFFRSFKCND